MTIIFWHVAIEESRSAALQIGDSITRNTNTFTYPNEGGELATPGPQNL